MNLQAIAFYVLSIVTVGAALRVVSARNPVHSVLFLILSFFTAAGLFVLLGAEFLAMLLIEMVLVSYAVATNGAAAGHSPMVATPDISNAEAIGRVLYTDYIYFFQAAGLVLLVAMIGAIVLTLRHRPGVKRQNIAAQVGRTPKSGMEIVHIEDGAGISE